MNRNIRRRSVLNALGVSSLFSFGCAGRQGNEEPAHDVDVEPPIELSKIAPSVWVHTSHQQIEGLGWYPSNGLVVQGQDGVILVDTAWGQSQTRQLFDVVDSRFGGVRCVIVTHFHDDRLGGLEVLHGRRVMSFGSRRTVELAKELGVTAPQRILESKQSLGKLGIDAQFYYPGPGHTVDNMVVYLSPQRLLFGGCLVRAEDTESAGNTADADLASWGASITRLQRRFPDAKVVVPGHGPPGGSELLVHTLNIVRG